jgi:EamA domain-containing membrane protein RarD
VDTLSKKENGLPFASMIGGALFLGECIRFIHLVAFVLTVLGRIIGTCKRKEHLNDISHYETIGKS